MTPGPSPLPQPSHHESSAPRYSTSSAFALAYGTRAHCQSPGVVPWASWYARAFRARSMAARSPLNAYQSTAESVSIA